MAEIHSVHAAEVEVTTGKPLEVGRTHPCSRREQSEEEAFPKCHLIRLCEDEITAIVQEQISRTLVDSEGNPISPFWLGTTYQQKLENMLSTIDVFSSFASTLLSLAFQMVTGSTMIIYSGLLVWHRRRVCRTLFDLADAFVLAVRHYCNQLGAIGAYM